MDAVQEPSSTFLNDLKVISIWQIDKPNKIEVSLKVLYFLPALYYVSELGGGQLTLFLD